MSGSRPRTSELRQTAAIAAALLVALVAALASAGAADASDRMRRADSRQTFDPLDAIGVVREAASEAASFPIRSGFREASAAGTVARRGSAARIRDRLAYAWPARVAAFGRGLLAPPRA